MSFKRRVLSALGKDVLLEIGRGLELDVTTRMGVEALRDALAKSKRVLDHRRARQGRTGLRRRRPDVPKVPVRIGAKHGGGSIQSGCRGPIRIGLDP